MSFEDLRHTAIRGQREDFEKFLQLVPDVPAQASDALTPDAFAAANVCG